MHPSFSGQPTTKEKAKLFIESLDLGSRAIPVTSTSLPAILHRNTTRGKRTLTNPCPGSTIHKICGNTASKEIIIVCDCISENISKSHVKSSAFQLIFHCFSTYVYVFPEYLLPNFRALNSMQCYEIMQKI